MCRQRACLKLVIREVLRAAPTTRGLGQPDGEITDSAGAGEGVQRVK